MTIIVEVLCAIYLCIAFYTDVTRSKIPNRLTVPIAILGVGLHVATDSWTGFLYAIYGAGAGFAILFVLYLFRAVGAGDVKLFAALGAVTGLQFTLQSLMYSVLYAGAIALIIMLVRRKTWISFEEGKMLKFPFMYAVLPGAVTAFLYMP
ncbi:A24 family peptidase [Paenibacillus guangzhouensis]|uniref:A24 family peptidase n=1 Tax=Paenibacillus guangzhouensis TaxID=1473112 RepID=UPI001D0F84C2|nr:A24 family peptidase [Paenibacillus guangzhouensis]